MQKRKNKKKRIKIRYIIFITIIIYGTSTFINQQGMIKELEKKKTIREEKIGQLNEEIQRVQEKIQYSHTPEYLEKIARDELGMVKPEETIFIDKSKNKFIKGLKD